MGTCMYVPFGGYFTCFQVEVWLNKLLDTMQSTIRHEMTEAVVSYEEKPRDQWLFDPPAQVDNNIQIQVKQELIILFSVTLGCTCRNSNLVDHRSELVLCKTRRGLRECSQRLLQEAGA